MSDSSMRRRITYLMLRPLQMVYCTVRYGTVPYTVDGMQDMKDITILYLHWQFDMIGTVIGTVQYRTIRYCTVPYGTVPYQYGTDVRYGTVELETVVEVRCAPW
jgi:hypothetical protein